MAADYTGKDQRLKYLFQNGGGGGSACLYDADKVNGLVVSMIQANASLAEILQILRGGGGSGGFVVHAVVPSIVITLSSTESVEVEVSI